MGEHEFELSPGQLYFIEPNESTSLVGHVTDASVESSTEDNDISVPVASLVDIETAFDWFVKMTKDTMLAITGMYTAVLNCCPDRRVAHLAVNGKTARIRKKNFNRAIKILEDLDERH